MKNKSVVKIIMLLRKPFFKEIIIHTFINFQLYTFRNLKWKILNLLSLK